jgi:hypothetical protein
MSVLLKNFSPKKLASYPLGNFKVLNCTICNKMISKTNWSKHEKTLMHSSGTNSSMNLENNNCLRVDFFLV